MQTSLGLHRVLHFSREVLHLRALKYVQTLRAAVAEHAAAAVQQLTKKPANCASLQVGKRHREMATAS